MNLEGLRAFLAVAAHGSFAGAATALGASRTSLRRHVDALEVAVGVPLLRRTPTGVALTEAGERLLASGRGLERELKALVESIRDTATTPTGLIRVLMPVGLPPVALHGAMALIRASWPGLLVRVRFADDPLATNVADVDLLVAFSNRPDLHGWHTSVFASTPLRLVAARSYLERHPPITSLAELDAHDLYVWAPGTAEPAIHAHGRPHPVHPVLATSDVHLLHSCARTGAGIAWVPDASLGADPALVGVLPGIAGAPLEIRIATPTHLASSARAQVFFRQIDRLRDVTLANLKT